MRFCKVSDKGVRPENFLYDDYIVIRKVRRIDLKNFAGIERLSRARQGHDLHARRDRACGGIVDKCIYDGIGGERLRKRRRHGTGGRIGSENVNDGVPVGKNHTGNDV